VGDLVARGAEEDRVREHVTETVRLGRGARRRAPVEEEDGRG
jgi:hypothetical protein